MRLIFILVLLFVLLTAGFMFINWCGILTHEVNLRTYPWGGGEVYGEDDYWHTGEVTVEAESDEGYSFIEWVEEGETVSTEKKYEFVIENDRELVAVFKEEEGKETIEILDEEEQVIFEYTYDEFVEWAENHWEDLFEEIPSFHEDYHIYPEDLHPYFDDTATLSPCGNLLAFSVHDYHAATHMSFVGIANLQNGEVDLVDQKNRGQIEEFHWSPGSDYLAYVLNTTEVTEFFLSNDNVEQMSKEFTLDEEDIRKTLNEDGYTYFFPFFSDLSWREDEYRLFFNTRAPECTGARQVMWSIDPQGEDLIKESMVPGERGLLGWILKPLRDLFLC